MGREWEGVDVTRREAKSRKGKGKQLAKVKTVAGRKEKTKT